MGTGRSNALDAPHFRVDGIAERQIFTRRRVWLFGRLIPALYLFMLAKFFVRGDWLIARDGSRLWTDFLAVWSAGQQALAYGAASVYGMTALDAAQNAIVGNLNGSHLPFAYPPTFLLVAIPLSFIPYIAAHLMWQAVTLCMYATAVYLIIPRREAVALALAFPAVFSNIYVGQEALLATALLGGALAILDRRPILAGILIGLLTFRPQLGILIPIVLIGTGRWKAFGAAAVTAICLVGVSVFSFGLDAWRAFILHAPEHASAALSYGQGTGSWMVLQSVYALVRTIGGGAPLAWCAQLAIAVTAATAVVWVWRADVRYELKASALVLGAALVSPYLYFYDLAMLAIPVAFLIADGLKYGFVRHERATILAATLAAAIFIPGFYVPLGPPMVIAISVVVFARLRSGVRGETHEDKRDQNPGHIEQQEECSTVR